MELCMLVGQVMPNYGYQEPVNTRKSDLGKFSPQF